MNSQTRSFTFFWVCFASLIFSNAIAFEDYPKNPHVEQGIWNSLKPYFLPSTMPIKKELDALFKKDVRVTASKASLLEAGFTFTKEQGICAVVLKHPQMPGYVFKVMVDDEDTRQDFKSWLNRIEGAKAIRNAIAKFNYGHLFFVPDKWVYPLPAEPSPAAIMGGGRKNFILIATNVHPHSRNENIKRWKELKDKKVLDALYAILIKTGAADSIKENNIPWCKNGKIAFVDTEHTQDFQKIRFKRLEKVLNKKMCAYWQKLYMK